MWPRRSPRAAAVLFAVLALAAPAAGVALSAPAAAAATGAAPVPASATLSGAGGTPSPAGAATTTPGAALQQRPDPATVIRVNLTPGGDARWTVNSRFRLDNETDRAAFRAMVADLENGTDPPPQVGYSASTFRAFAERVEAATNRSEMRIVDPRWSGRVENDTGVVTLSFTWTQFARTEDGRVILGDVFRADVGWFSSLTDDQQLVIAPPPNYAVTESPFPIDERGTIRIDGPEDVPGDVTAENVSVVYAPTAGPTPTPTPDGPLTGLLPGAALIAAAVVVAAYLLYRRSPDDDSPAGGAGAATADTDTDTGGGTAAERPAGSGSDSTPTDSPSPTADTGTGADEEAAATATGAETDTASADANADAADGGADTDAGADEETEVDEALLSDEERIEHLLEENGGRMKQATIVSETGWSNAKVSQLLSAMDEADRVDKLRLGRENLISLPGEDVVNTDGTPGESDAGSGPGPTESGSGPGSDAGAEGGSER